MTAPTPLRAKYGCEVCIAGTVNDLAVAIGGMYKDATDRVGFFVDLSTPGQEALAVVAGGVEVIRFTKDTTNQIGVTGDIDLASGCVYKVDADQVVGARITGWAAPTGTPTRTTFDTTTVTTAQLAERVKALIDDLTTHGLIGA